MKTDSETVYSLRVRRGFLAGYYLDIRRQWVPSLAHAMPFPTEAKAAAEAATQHTRMGWPAGTIEILSFSLTA